MSGCGSNCGCSKPVDVYDEYGVNTTNSFNTPPKIWDGEPPKTYEEYMASGIVDRMWEAGFIAGKTHEIQREIERKMGGSA